MKIEDIEEFPIISFPIEWIYLYRTILLLIDDEHCDCKCNKDNNLGITAYHSFIIAAAAYNIGKINEANNIIKDIKLSLTNYTNLLKYPFLCTIGNNIYKFYKDGNIEKIEIGESEPDQPNIPDEPDDNPNKPDEPDEPTNTYTNNFYIGSISIGSSDFNDMSTPSIVNFSEKKTASSKNNIYVTKDNIFECSEQIIFFLIPSTGKLDLFKFRSYGFDSDIIEDIKVKDDVTIIDGELYKCYWYRNAGCNSNNKIIYTYRLKFTNE